MKELIRKSLPTRYFLDSEKIGTRNIFLTFSPMRSGQHAVIDWICRGLPRGTIHFNLCGFLREGLCYTLWPWNGRRVIYSENGKDDSGEQGRRRFQKEKLETLPGNLVFSVEDRTPLDFGFTRLIRRNKCLSVLILRDPANWLASSLQMNYKSKEELLEDLQMKKKLLRLALGEIKAPGDMITINYCEWCDSREYRNMISTKFEAFNVSTADSAREATPDFGGGSSFQKSTGRTRSTMDRWKHYKDDAFFNSALRDRELYRLSRQFFGEIPGVRLMEKLLETHSDRG